MVTRRRLDGVIDYAAAIGIFCLISTALAGALPGAFPRLLDHDDFGLSQSKIINVIDSKSLERDAGGKPGSAFPHPALELK
jgi:hypothetical protein